MFHITTHAYNMDYSSHASDYGNAMALRISATASDSAKVVLPWDDEQDLSLTSG